MKPPRRRPVRLLVEPLEDRCLLAAGTLDPTFHGDGALTLDLGGLDTARAVAVQDNYRIVVAGDSGGAGPAGFQVVRLTRDGYLDFTFAGDGKQAVPFGAIDRANAIALQPDGKIVLAGSTGDGVSNHFAVARLNADGSLDTTFDGDGKLVLDLGAHDEATAVLVQPDGKLVVAGFTDAGAADFAVVRLTADGSLDPTFSGDGKATADFVGEDLARGAALQPDGKVVLAGSSTAGAQLNAAVARFTTDGSLDATFDSDGLRLVSLDPGSDEATAILVQPDGRIVVAGTNDVVFLAARLLGDGALDATFDGDGVASIPFVSAQGQAFASARSATLQDDGKIVLAGRVTVGPESDFAVARLNPSGSLDPTFGDGGRKSVSLGGNVESAHAIAFQRDGELVLAGETGLRDFAVLRLIGSPWVLIAPDPGSPPVVRLSSPSGTVYRQLVTFGPTFRGGVRVASADLNGDTVPDIVAAPGPGGAPFVNIFDGATFQFLRQFQVFGSSFTGGLFVAVANVLGPTGPPQILVTPDAGGAPFVNVFSLTGQLLRQFPAYGLSFTGGVRLATGDVTGDGIADVLTAPGPGGAPFINQFNASTGTLVRQFQVFGNSFTAGLYVAAGNFNNTGTADVLVGAGGTGLPTVNAFEGSSGALIRQYQAYAPAFTSGVRVSAVDVTNDGISDVLVAPGSGAGQQRVKVFHGATAAELEAFLAYDTDESFGLFAVGVDR